jgi:hypothetical protein
MMVVPGYDTLPANLQAAALRLSQWLSEDVATVANATGNTIPGRDVDREWSMNWKQFSNVVAMYTRPKLSTSTESMVDGKSVPYIVSRFEKKFLDDNGRQLVSIEFAVYEKLLESWMS